MSEPREKTAEEKHAELIAHMAAKKKEWDAEDARSPDGPDETDALLSAAIEAAIAQGKGWSEEERAEYIAKISDDEFIPPIFASTHEELEKSGLADAFTSLMCEDDGTKDPGKEAMDCKKKGNDAFMNGKKNLAKNMQYYRDAVNHYYEGYAWAHRVKTVGPDFAPEIDEDGHVDEGPFFTEEELEEFKSVLCANAAMAHMQLKNWGHVRDEATKAVDHDKNNVKAWYRLAKAHQMLKEWEEAGDAIDSGLSVPGEENNKDLTKLRKLLSDKVRKARIARQKRERARAERVSNVKQVWKHCSKESIQLGRVPLVSTVTDDIDDDVGEEEEWGESRWHDHHPHTGRLPELSRSSTGEEWTWPCMFVYPSHKQSDFVSNFAESEMIALRMAEMFPEMEGDGDNNETEMPWDYRNEFRCSKLAVYFEVHCTEGEGDVVHPDFVGRLKDQGATMRFYEASRALKGDEGPEMTEVARCAERRRLYKQRIAWKKKHGSLWAKPDLCPVVRVHPAMTLKDVLVDKRMVVPNFLVTFLLFPENHPAHAAFLKDRKCLGIIQPKNLE